jgi:undecaprenyl diphosphate synthase
MREDNIIVDKAKSLVNLGRRITGTEKTKVPIHVAIIPDGNRRWATEKGLDPSFGHYKSASYENVKSLIREAKDLGVRYLSFWGFSTENWSRNQLEIKAIFDLVSDLIERLRKDAKENKVRFRHIGRKDRLPEKLVQQIREMEEETKNYLDINIQLCLDYGGRDEIMRAVNKMLRQGNKNVNEETIKESLDTCGIPDPDLIIRTSGEQRLSGFMPFQSVYAELYFTEVYFPDFDALELRKAVEEFSRRQRRFGGNQLR